MDNLRSELHNLVSKNKDTYIRIIISYLHCQESLAYVFDYAFKIWQFLNYLITNQCSIHSWKVIEKYSDDIAILCYVKLDFFVC